MRRGLRCAAAREVAAACEAAERPAVKPLEGRDEGGHPGIVHLVKVFVAYFGLLVLAPHTLFHVLEWCLAFGPVFCAVEIEYGREVILLEDERRCRHFQLLCGGAKSGLFRLGGDILGQARA